jgi:hypothetical protein
VNFRSSMGVSATPPTSVFGHASGVPRIHRAVGTGKGRFPPW